MIIIEDAGVDDATHIYMDDNIMWAASRGGSASLLTRDGRGIDFVRWGGDTTAAPKGLARHGLVR